MAFVAASASAQQPPPDGELQPIEAPPPVTPDMLALARDAAARGDAAEALSRYLRVLAAEPDNVAALGGAGRAALDVGDVNAAVAFYARAEDKAPRDGPVKAGLAVAETQLGNARAALRFFHEAVELGVPAASIAADRGLAYDLRGEPKRAQAEYLVAMHAGPSDELTRRMALSQAIGGDRVGALATLDPLLRRQDVAAWRARAFVYAITGDAAAAGRDALTVMSRDHAEALQPYFVRIATLRPADKALAVHLGRFPKPAQVAGASPPPVIVRPMLAFDGAATAGPATTNDASAAARAEADARNWSLQAHGATPAPSIAAPVPVPATPMVSAKAAAKARAQARAEQAATAKARRQSEEEAMARAEAKQNPSRQWVQVAGGANKTDLPKAWAKLKAQWPGPLAGRAPWTMHYRYTNRLLIGPFASEDEAQDYVTKHKAEGMGAFRVATASGTAVERLATK